MSGLSGRRPTWWWQAALKNPRLLGAVPWAGALLPGMGGGWAGGGDGWLQLDFGAKKGENSEWNPAPRKMVFLEWPQMGFRYPLGELSSVPSHGAGNLESLGGRGESLGGDRAQGLLP